MSSWSFECMAPGPFIGGKQKRILGGVFSRIACFYEEVNQSTVRSLRPRGLIVSTATSSLMKNMDDTRWTYLGFISSVGDKQELCLRHVNFRHEPLLVPLI